MKLPLTSRNPEVNDRINLPRSQLYKHGLTFLLVISLLSFKQSKKLRELLHLLFLHQITIEFSTKNFVFESMKQVKIPWMPMVYLQMRRVVTRNLGFYPVLKPCPYKLRLEPEKVLKKEKKILRKMIFSCLVLL